MSRKIVRLTLDHLPHLPEHARTCLFWELDPVRRQRITAAEAAGEKEAWVSGVLREWGSCGRVALVDDEPVGLVTYMPPAYAAGAGAFPTAPLSPDALLMTTVLVDPRHRGGGIGRMLVQGMARDLIKRGGYPVVETFGDTRGRSTHVLPADFLAAVGFKTLRAHATTPRMRMELRSAVTWKDEVEQAVERLLGVVRPARATRPDPAGREESQPM